MDDLGVSGAFVIFSVDGLNMYQTSAVSPSAVSGSSVAGTSDAAMANLIQTGQATPVKPNYIAQFPWTGPQSG